MAAADADIDRLYQLPLDEFTGARNALARQSGDAAVKALQKPNIAAWAVNQLYWHRRRDYDRIVAAATKLRDAHLMMLAGKNADVAAAEKDQAAAVRAGVDAVREILREAGEAESPATLTSVQETLNAVPGDELPGRLTRPLKPRGFEALLGLVKPGAPVARKLTAVPAPAKRPEAPTKRDQEAERKAAEAKRREREALAEELREAKAAARKAATAAEQAKTAHVRAQEEQRELQEQLEALEQKIRELAFTSKRLEKEAASAASAVERLEFRRDQLN